MGRYERAQIVCILITAFYVVGTVAAIVVVRVNASIGNAKELYDASITPESPVEKRCNRTLCMREAACADLRQRSVFFKAANFNPFKSCEESNCDQSKCGQSRWTQSNWNHRIVKLCDPEFDDSWTAYGIRSVISCAYTWLVVNVIILGYLLGPPVWYWAKHSVYYLKGNQNHFQMSASELRIIGLKESIAAAERNIASQKTSIASQKASIAAAERNIASQKASIASQKARLKSLTEGGEAVEANRKGTEDIEVNRKGTEDVEDARPVEDAKDKDRLVC